MKSLLRVYVYHLLALYLATVLFADSFGIKGIYSNYLLAALILSGLNILVKPILKLVFFPINALSLGLFSLVINAFVFYIFCRLTDFIQIKPWLFPGFAYHDFRVEALNLGFIETLIIISAVISLMYNFMHFLAR